MTVRTVIYVRVSTAEQAKDGTSLADQKARCEGFALGQGWQVDAVYTDAGVSGAALVRPAYTRMVQAIAAGHVDVVLASAVDRLSRSKVGFPELSDLCQRAGAHVVTLDGVDTSTDAGDLVGGIRGIMSAAERRVIRDRTVRGRLNAAAEGRWVMSRTPYGYRRAPREEGRGWQLVPDETHSAALRHMFARVIEDGAPVAAVAQELNERGWTTNDGKAWTTRYLYGWLGRASTWEHAAGRIVFGGIAQQWPAILTAAQVAAGAAWASGRRRGRVTAGPYLLTPHRLLMPCGRSASGLVRSHRSTESPKYACSRRWQYDRPEERHGDCHSVHMESMDALVRDTVRATLTGPGSLRAIAAYAAARDATTFGDDLAGLDAEAGRISDRIAQITAALTGIRVDAQALRKALAPWVEQADEVRRRRDAVLREKRRRDLAAHVDTSRVVSAARRALTSDERCVWEPVLEALDVHVRITGYVACQACGGNGLAPGERGGGASCPVCQRMKQLPVVTIQMADVLAGAVAASLAGTA